MEASKPTLLVLIGPTAVGKTKTAIELSKKLDANILSADSRQFYKELSIGTAKPTSEELTTAPHHFVGHLSISQDYNASDFEKEVLAFLDGYFKEKKIAILCGGSGMYVDAITKGFDSGIPTSDPKIRQQLIADLETKGLTALQEQLKSLDPRFYKEVDLNNSKRLMRAIEVCLVSGKPYSQIRKGKKADRPFHIIKVGLNLKREVLYERINRRVDLMIAEGLLEEVKAVQAYRDKNALKTVGYRELFDYWDGKLTFEEAVEKIKVNSRRYAKRQLTWFKKDSETSWFEPGQISEILEYIRISL